MTKPTSYGEVDAVGATPGAAAAPVSPLPLTLTNFK